jgi:hypothetical protein
MSHPTAITSFDCKKAKMFIYHTDFIVSPYNLTCHLRMLNLTIDLILVTMDTILAGKYGLPRYEKMVIYKMEKLQVQTTPTMMFNMSIESTDPPQSKSQGTILKFCLWGE